MPLVNKTGGMSADELLVLAEAGKRHELIDGNLIVMSPAGGRHGRVANRMAWLLSSHVEEQHLGIVFSAETGFRISSNPDTVIAPDVGFVERIRYEQVEDETRFLPLAPDLAVEVISPCDTFTQVENKAFRWLDAGCRLVLLVDPDSETVHTYRSRTEIRVYDQGEIDCGDAVRGWSFSMKDLFGK